jgi:methylmalonyl-CoA mutase N-terminal domain/subunit
MYRSRMWTLRTIVGYGTPDDTRKGVDRALQAGSGGIDVVLDALSQEAIDPDHPSFREDVGQDGCSLACVDDLERLLVGIDVTRTDIAWHASVLLYPMLVALARRRGSPVEKLVGSHMPDHLQLSITGYGPKVMPADLAHRATVDCLEYVARTTPRWVCGFPQGYNLRERGLTPVGEIAVGMAIVTRTLGDLRARGIAVDDIAPCLAWVSSSDIDLFEEVAKYRALRRVWATILRTEFGAERERSLRVRIACHTSGRSLTWQQPMNNIVRATVQTLAAILGGVQSVETCSWDEPVSIPTDFAREISIRTQQILAHEVGAARTADPLGGSWYVEALTDEIERQSLELLDEIRQRDLLEAVSSGWLEDLMDKQNTTIAQELKSRDRVLVGVNAFQRDEGEAPARFEFDRGSIEAHLGNFARLRHQRDDARLRVALHLVRDAAAAGKNSVGPMVDAFEADATIGEVWGVFRQGLGHSYDPFGMLTSPLDDDKG